MNRTGFVTRPPRPLRALPPAGQAEPSPAPPAPAPAPAPDTSAAAPPVPISIGADGRLVGIQPILDQISESVAGVGGQLFEEHVWPVIQRDTALQREVGAAAGRAAAATLRPWVILGTLGIVTIAGIKVWKLATGRYPK